MSETGPEQRQRVDKWLWVARFFKTRSLAAEAVSGGKVHVEGQRAKPAKLIGAGTRLEIRRGEEAFEVVVRALHPQRRPAREAAALYEELPESVASREQARAARAEAARQRALRAGRPTKRDRRKLSELKTLG